MSLNTLYIFFAGFVGAGVLELYRLYKYNRKNFNYSKSKMLVSLLFSLVGGYLAVILEAPSLVSAFYTGLGLPLIISGGSSEVKRRGIQPFGGGKTLGWKDYISSIFD